jgi:hypothetical protein
VSLDTAAASRSLEPNSPNSLPPCHRISARGQPSRSCRYLVAESRVGSGDESVHRRALALYGAGLHAAFSSEERYFRSIFMESLALPGVLDRGKNKCRSLKLFIAQNMVTSVKSSLQSASQPRVINAAIVSALSSTGEPADATPRARLHSGSTFEPLCNFVPVTAPRKSSLNLDAHAVLSDVDLRMHYQVFATRTNNIDMVMLYRKLEDMMGTLHSAIAAEDVPTFHKVNVQSLLWYPIISATHRGIRIAERLLIMRIPRFFFRFLAVRGGSNDTGRCASSQPNRITALLQCYSQDRREVRWHTQTRAVLESTV